MTATMRSLRFYEVFGLISILSLCLGLGTWAGVASISGAVIGQARVVVESNAKKVQHMEGGIVSELLVKNGDRVEAGQVLIRLDQIETRVSLAIINAQLNELLARRARLDAERDLAQTVTFPPALDAQRDNPDILAILKGQETLFIARQEAMQGEKEQLKARIAQFKDEIDGLVSQQASKETQARFIKQELDALRQLRAKGLVTLNRILALEREAARLEGERGQFMGEIAKKRGEISETELRIIQIDKNSITEIITETREIQTKVAELLEKRLAAETRLTRTEIRSPKSGFIHELDIHTVGGVIGASEALMLIVPEQDRLVFEARVRPEDIDQIKPGHSAIIRVTAFAQRLTPELTGQVQFVSADASTDKQDRTAYYLVRLHVASEELQKLGHNKVLLPGMPAEVFIQTEERTVWNYLMKPLTDQMAHAFRER